MPSHAAAPPPWTAALIASATGIGLCAWLPELPSYPVIIAALCAGVIMVLAARRQRWAAAMVLGALVAGVAWGALHGHTLVSHRVASGCEGQTLDVVGRVASLPAQRRSRFAQGVGFRFQVETLLPNRCAGPRNLSLYWFDADTKPRAGELWALQVRLKRPRGLSKAGPAGRQPR